MGRTSARESEGGTELELLITCLAPTQERSPGGAAPERALPEAGGQRLPSDEMRPSRPGEHR